MRLHSRRRKLAQELAKSPELSPLPGDAPLSVRLMEAARQGQDQAVEELVEAGADVNHLDSDGWSALMAAAMGNCPSTIGLLAERGAHLDLAAAPRGRTALIEAAWQENPQAVKALLEWGADPNLKDSLCGTAISDTQCCDCILLLARGGAEVGVDRSRYPGTSLLAHAAVQGRLDVMKELVLRGAPMDAGALVQAARKSQGEVVRWLLEQGADPNRRTPTGEAPLMGAAESRHAVELLKLLIQHGADLGQSSEALHHAIHADNLEALEFLLSHGLREVAAGEPGLHRAASLGRTRMVRRWVQVKGTQVDVRDLQNRTPLMRACASGALDTTDVLLAAGADLEARDSNGHNPLFHSIAHGQIPVSLRLLAAGADLESRDNEGRTALMFAAAGGKSSPMVSVLLRLGAQVEARVDQDYTALLLALVNPGQCDLEAIQALLAAGANPQGLLARFCQAAAWQNASPQRDKARAEALRLLVQRGEQPAHSSVLLYARVRKDRRLNTFLAGHGVTRQQIDAVEIPPYLGYDWH